MCAESMSNLVWLYYTMTFCAWPADSNYITFKPCSIFGSVTAACPPWVSTTGQGSTERKDPALTWHLPLFWHLLRGCSGGGRFCSTDIIYYSQVCTNIFNMRCVKIKIRYSLPWHVFKKFSGSLSKNLLNWNSSRVCVKRNSLISFL